MNLISARQAWHDCTYRPAPGQFSDTAELGVVVQNTKRGPTANHAIHFILAGHIQSAIARLPLQIRSFGEFMYAADRDDDVREAAEAVVFAMVQSRSPRMTAVKRGRLEFVVQGVMWRYQYMHQGGQFSNEDPLANAAKFRAWLWQVFGVQLESPHWERLRKRHLDVPTVEQSSSAAAMSNASAEICSL